MKNLLNALFDNNLTQDEVNEVNAYLKFEMSDLEVKVVGPYEELYDKFDDSDNFGYEFNYQVDDETFHTVLDFLVRAYPRTLFRSTKGKTGKRCFYLNSVEPIYEESFDNLTDREELEIGLDRFKDLKPGYESFVYGEFERDFDEEDILSRDKGLFHEVVLLKDGSILSRGSNVSGQLDFGLDGKYKSVVCGRYFTALLKEDGTVELAGKSLDYFMNHVPHKTSEVMNDIYNGYDGEDIQVGKHEFVSLDVKFEDHKLIVSDDDKSLFEMEMHDEENIFVGVFTQNYMMYQKFINTNFRWQFIPDYVYEVLEARPFKKLEALKDIIAIEKLENGLFVKDASGHSFTVLDADNFFGTYLEQLDMEVDTDWS